jgi:hypothetical protein
MLSRLKEVNVNSGTDLRSTAGYTGIVVARSPVLNHEDGSVQRIIHVLTYITDNTDTVSTTTNSIRNLFRAWTPDSPNTIPIIIVVKVGNDKQSMLDKEAYFLLK